MSVPIQIDRIEAYAMSAAVAGGPKSSLGVITKRNGLIVKIHDSQGGFGWGEVWCNFPPRHAEAMAMLIEDVIGPVVLSKRLNHWRELRPSLENTFERMILHTGQYGSFAHCFSAFDTAIADLCSRRDNISLASFLRSEGSPDTTIDVYASSPSSGDLRADIASVIAQGHQRVKLKIGYDPQKDSETLTVFETASVGKLQLLVDANQAWSLPEAIAACEKLARLNPMFVEEPLRADAPMSDWCTLTQKSSVALAAGENIVGASSFNSFIDQRGLTFVQPDVAKWGGVSGAFDVASSAHKAGSAYAFHYMGTGLGLAASLQVCAAAQGRGPVELDANENPLRVDLGEIDLTVTDGKLSLPQGAGLGFIPDLGSIARYTDRKMDIHS